MIPNTTDAKAEGSMDFDVYSVQAATDEAEDKEMLERVDAAKRAKETDYRRKWSSERRYAAGVLESLKFELAMGALLLFNFVVVVIESDETATCVHETKDTSRCNTNTSFVVINALLLGVYCVEFLVKAAIWQCDLFRNKWNLFDGSIVLASLIETVLQLTGFLIPSMQFLRVFRLARLVRTVKLLQMFPELYFMVQGFASAVAAMWWGFLLIAMWIIAWSILSVELVNPANQEISHDSEYCAEAFSSVYKAFLLFFQTLVAGDSWGACILPILQDAPYFGVIFVGAMVSIQLGFTNLVLSVIVDAASKERNSEAKLHARVKKTQEIEAKEALTKMFVAMDGDKTGTITLEEFVQGYESDPEMRRQMAILRIGREDLDTVFALIDEDSSGSLELGEFCRFIAGVQESDNRVSIMMLKTLVGRVLQKVEGIQAAMENVAVVTGAAPVPIRSRRRANKFKYRLSNRVYGGFRPMASAASLPRRCTKSNLSREANSGSKSTPSFGTGNQASATSTAQQSEAAANGRCENQKVTAQLLVQKEATATVPLADDHPGSFPAADFDTEASSLSYARGKQGSMAPTTQRDEAAAKGGGENEEETGSAPLAAIPDIVPAAGALPWEPMPETDITKRTPQASGKSRGIASRPSSTSEEFRSLRGINLLWSTKA